MSDIAPFDSSFAHGIYKQKYAWPGEEWPDTAHRVACNVLGAVGMENTLDRQLIEKLIVERKFIPGGRYLYASGRGLHQTQNCLLLKPTDDREGWAKLADDGLMALMTGAGIGAWYGDVRCSGSLISRTGGVSSGPLSLMKVINEIGRNVMQGGARRAAIWAGLPWWHADIFDFIRAKDWPEWVRRVKAGEDVELADGTVIPGDFTFPAPLDMTNISVTLDDAFFEALSGDVIGICDEAFQRAPEGASREEFETAPDGSGWDDWAQRVYDLTLDKMLTTAEPGFSVDTGENAGEYLRNACTEITSYDDSDVCNLGSLNLAAFDSLAEFDEAVELATLFLLAGTVYSDLPYAEVYKTREKNRRLGLGVMGVHEWLLKRGKRYGPDDELGEWLEAYARSTDHARVWAKHLHLSEPVKTRAIAPNGTIGIIAETTTSAEPIFCAAYKRRVRNAHHSGDRMQYEYVVDPTVSRLICEGVDPNSIEDAYTLSLDVERRIAFQAWMQQYVDHGISSTVNLPASWRDSTPDEQQEFGEMLLRYLPRLRGITAYPDGARGGQPLTPVDVQYALEQQGVRFEESEERCVGGACGV